MNVLVGDLKQTKCATNGKRVDVYFEVPLAVGRKTIKAEVHVLSTDGSIPEHRGKYYACLEGNIGQKSFDPNRWMVDCPQCENELAGPIAGALFPRLKELGYTVATWRNPGGWYLFSVRSPTLGEIKWTGNNRHAGPELVIAEYQQTLRCPFHGQVVRYDNEPID